MPSKVVDQTKRGFVKYLCQSLIDAINYIFFPFFSKIDICLLLGFFSPLMHIVYFKENKEEEIKNGQCALKEKEKRVKTQD